MSGEVVYLEVISLRGTFRRAGFTFDKTPKVIECSTEQAARIRAEHNKALKVRDAQPGDAPVEVTLASLDERIAALKSENDALSKANADASARIAELEAIAAKAHADADALKSENAKLVAELEAATAPKSAKGESKPEPKPAK